MPAFGRDGNALSWYVPGTTKRHEETQPSQDACHTHKCEMLGYVH